MARITARSVSPSATNPKRTLAVPSLTGETPIKALYRKHFPVGLFWDMGGGATMRHPDGGTWQVGPQTFGGFTIYMEDKDIGLLRSGIFDFAETNGAPYNDEVVQTLATQIEADPRFNRVTRLVHPTGSYDGNIATDAPTNYWPDANDHDTLAPSWGVGITGIYNGHESVIAYSVRDDLGVNVALDGHEASAAKPLIAAIQANDADGRAATAVLLPGAPAVIGSDLKLGFTFVYPYGYYSNLTPTLEGDHHAARFGDPPGIDYIDHLNRMRDEVWAVNPAAPFWACIQAHRTEVSQSGLRYPTGREIALQGWVAISQGATGIYAFAWTDGPYEGGTWVGLGSVGGEERLSGFVTFANRITQRIKKPLLRCRPNCTAFPIADGTFTATGGGSTTYTTNYANATINTLQDQIDGTKYAVVVNRALVTSNITVGGSGLSGGTLVNLEDGSETALGGTVSLDALDGSIWRYEP